MSWYSNPIQPIDPVVVSQTPKPPARYMRDNFMATGQNSYVKPPAQDQSMWQSLLNVQPITQGILNQRWGYVQFAGLSGSPNRLYNFQSDSLGTRTIITAGTGGIRGFNEDGSIYNSNIFTPVASGAIIRSVTSRNFQYFCDGNNALNTSTHLTADSLKWNGAPTGGVSNIGIVNTDVAQNNSGGGSTGNVIGPNTGSGTVADIPASAPNPWAAPGSIYTNNPPAAATVNLYETVTGFQKPNGLWGFTLSNIHTSSDVLKAIGFNFTSIPGNIGGIQVAITCQAFDQSSATVASESADLSAVMLKYNAGTGTARTQTLSLGGPFTTLTFGGPTDLWGTSFAQADVVNAQFGVSFFTTAGFHIGPGNVDDPSGTASIIVKVSYITITIFLAGASGNTSNSGNGVGILSGVGGGSINLTLGRIYYLVANNSITGHFSDLSSASNSSGAATNAEYNLILATYNDPQVDTKYVLATADGGDPSILYEVQVLIPGLTISSWAIAANIVTFTGVYTGPQFVNGQSVTIGGLSHGSYLNAQTLSVTASTPTTFTAAFTHANDSATEIGIAGQPSFSIPNGITTVVDNTPDPTLVLDQPLVFTDIFGSEFGLTLNTPPPAGNLIIKHQGRLWMAGVPGATHSVFFSKSVAELTLPNGFVAGKYEEAWPGSNYFDVSDGAESVSGFLSDGTTLYIGTQNHIRRLLGNSPANFIQPQIVHPEVGLINQEVWQLTFMQGAPSGGIWLTPDFRVIQSDFNTYVDIGVPIQDILNNLKVTAATLAHAAFVADGEFELYILAVPYKQSTYCDTHLVFDLRARQWFVWQPASGSLSLEYNITQNGVPQWLFINGAANQLNIYDQTATTDSGITIPVTATTTWMHLGEPTRRKVLNEIQVYGNAGITMQVDGANNLTDFSSPVHVVYKKPLKLNPFNAWVLYLTGAVTRHRYYQFTFNANNGSIPFLGSYAISFAGLDDI